MDTLGRQATPMTSPLILAFEKVESSQRRMSRFDWSWTMQIGDEFCMWRDFSGSPSGTVRRLTQQ